MKRWIIILMMAAISSVMAQDKYSTKTARIDFEASVPSFEEVKAQNENVSAILNTSTGDFASLALVNAFRFKVALMEEHFNENYMESSKYPKALFKGVLKDFNLDKIGTSPTDFQLSGTLTIHGESKPFETMVRIYKKQDLLFLDTAFELKPADFNIEIPKVVSNKIAETIQVTAHYKLSK